MIGGQAVCLACKYFRTNDEHIVSPQGMKILVLDFADHLHGQIGCAIKRRKFAERIGREAKRQVIPRYHCCYQGGIRGICNIPHPDIATRISKYILCNMTRRNSMHIPEKLLPSLEKKIPPYIHLNIIEPARGVGLRLIVTDVYIH